MKSGAWISISGGVAVLGGIALMIWGRHRHNACMIDVIEHGGSQNPFECVESGMTPFVAGVILTPLGILASLVGGGIALVQYSK